ncbi:MAG TPA: D-glycero-beta-D-manno-heptose-7-phosphate kinase [Gammaproteobacteria bacterium]|uniref:D-glycero-beta-D-manno-heptose-7-phosphate kinase n=1 Tax=Immundisolibacter sp. TaxID=1934948 RepID=UPI000E8AD635|nr:D-glycero-beta-D-manno-heptose-7-phosphate kinase [Gammaproteobacteria bacterium]MCH78169.1 D-glycero-beta-D-manno-heptose-7-phosphate kinase [Gammaproteobacteria bacterium]
MAEGSVSTLTAADLGRLAGLRVLVIGDAMLDRYWHGAVDRISPEAPVPVVAVSSSEERLGGAANVARNVVALGGRARLLAVAGRDEAGDRLADLLAETAIEAQLLRDAQQPTTLKLRVLSRSQQLIRLDFEARPAVATLTQLQQAFHEALDWAQAVVLSDYGKGTLSQAEGLIGAARARGLMVVVDPKGHDYHRYRGASLLTPNRAEFTTVAGPWYSEDELHGKAADWLARLAVDRLLVTRSEQGMTLFRAGRPALHDPARAREVFDVSGAGDTVVAALALALAAGLEDPAAVHLANLAAGVVVGKLGTATATVEELAHELERD